MPRKDESAAGSSSATKASLDRKIVLRTMLTGFALMIVLVAGAAYFGYRQSLAIREAARAMIRDHSIDERDAGLEASIEQDSEQLLTELTWLLGACLVLAVGGSAVTVWITDRSFQQLEKQGDELSRVSWRLVDGHEKMARRFAHEMHDELGQSLTGLKSMLQHSPDPRRAEMTDLLNEVMGEMRELSQMMRPVILDDFGLDAALRWLRDRYVQRTQIRVLYESNLEGRLQGPVETHLFRVAQEALTNVARHSQATTVWIRLDAAKDRVRLMIEDDGVGLPEHQKTGLGLGMVGMRARMRQLNGTLLAERRSPNGTSIRAEAPLSEQPKQADEAEFS